ncbi:MAG: DUF4091 domain-containing protein [Bacteroidales bacterium]
MKFNRLQLLSVAIITLFLAACNNKPAVPLDGEPASPVPAKADEWSTVKSGLNGAAGSVYSRYIKTSPPENHESLEKELSLSAWRCERVNIELIFWNKSGSAEYNIISGELTGEDSSIPSASINTMVVKYILADEYLDGCGTRDNKSVPVHLVADILENGNQITLGEMETRALWVTVDIPPDAVAGKYNTLIRACSGSDTINFGVEINVSDLLLPPPAEWSFRLGLTINPFVVAGYHGVDNWSHQHIEILRPYLRMLAMAGQKHISTGLIDNGSDAEAGSMVTWIRNSDGTWEYDYSDFDIFVNLAMECGIDREIICYTGFPQNKTFRWFDEDTGSFIEEDIEPGTDEYRVRWSSFLYGLRTHLSENGWLDITTLSVGEGIPEEVSAVLSMVKSVTPEIGISVTGDYIQGAGEYISNYILPFNRLDDNVSVFAEKTMKNSGYTLFYTGCDVPRPNRFTFSPPAESALIPLIASAREIDGYTGEGIDKWTASPMTDSRYENMPSGGGYIIYPGPLSSVRFELLRDGIEEFEKLRILRDRLSMDPSSLAASAEKRIEQYLKEMTFESLLTRPAADIVAEGKKMADSISAVVAR